MNGENNQTGPEPWSDPAHEARVVAWVLGEASEFEIADLQRLLAENPELAAFKRRIEAVHGLLGEAAKPDAEPWSMASERRAALTAVIGSAPGAGPARTSVATRRAARNVIFMAAACVAGTLVVIKLVGPQEDYLSPMMAAVQEEEPLTLQAPASRGRIGDEREMSAAAPAPEMTKRMRSGDSNIVARDIDGMMMQNDKVRAIAGKPAAPSPAMARGAASAAAEPMSLPVPDGERAPAEESGATASFGFPRTPATPADNLQETGAQEFKGGGSGGGMETAGLASLAEPAGYLSSEEATTGTRRVPADVQAPAAAEAQASLAKSKGFENLGKFDDAKREAENSLRQEPASQEARKQLERIEGKKAEYAKSGYDQTRAEVLVEADKAWELTAPKDGEKGESAVADQERVPALDDIPLKGKLFDGRDAAPAAPTTTASIAPKPAERPAPLLQETLAAQEPVSTFSLNVSDASFQLAAAAVARGERPEPQSVRVEEFYNAFDYGDPSPAPGDKVAISVEQSAHPFAQQRNLVRVAMKTASLGRAANQPLHLTVLVDTSGSMEREDRAATVQRAFGSLAKLLGPNDVVSVVGFARQPRLLADRVAGDKAGGLAEVVKSTPAEGGTNLEEALKLAGQLATRQFSAKAQNRIVLITDGAANLGDAVPEQLAGLITEFRQRGIAFDACGVGSAKTGDEMLESLARRGDGRYYHLARAEDADAGFAQKLAGAFRPAAENVKVQVHFNPERVGHYRLIGFEKHRLTEEDFHNDKVDAAEMAADEAGVALYEVEVLPQGRGEIGAVAVRFRDSASGQMVERSQALRFDPNAPGFDQAPASLQLAGTAAMVGDLLRGGAPAARIELSSLAPIANALRGAFAHDGRVATLLDMLARLGQ